MALSDKQKQVFRRGVPAAGISAEINAVVTSGSAAALSHRALLMLRKMVCSKAVGDDINTAIETGAALSDRSIRQIQRALGNRTKANEYVTAIDALT